MNRTNGQGNTVERTNAATTWRRRTRAITALAAGVALVGLTGACKQTCLDDGFAWQQKEDCGAASATDSAGTDTTTLTGASMSATMTATMSASESESASASATDSASASATATDTAATATDSATDTAATDSATDTAATDSTTGGPACGNGQIDAGEVCDDGVNDGSYNGCMPGCMEIGPYCGDGMVFDGAELCDDGNDVDNDACSNACGADKCKEIMVTLEPLPPKVALVIDKSGSMVSNKWDHDADANTPTVTRWFSLHGVVTFILDNFQDQLDLGLVLFPSKMATQTYNAMACLVGAAADVDCATANKNAILAAMPPANSTSIAGGTPAAAGMLTAIEHLKSFDAKVNRSIVLVTDGAANCKMDAMTEKERFEVYDMNLHTIVDGALKNDNIFTYVVGIDISMSNTGNNQDGNPDNIVPFQKLNEVAILGGKPKDDPAEKFYAASNQIELQAALDAVANDALSCVVALDEPPVFPDNTKVFIGQDQVPHVTDCAMEDGWVYIGDPPTAIELCGSWCEQLKMTQMLDVEYYCKPG